jgi:hypothetical protein
MHTVKGQPMTSVPFVLYSLTSAAKDAVRAELFFKPLFRLQDLWFLLFSSYLAVILKCNIPVPVRIGLILAGVDATPPPMTIGAGFGMDLPEGGDFKYGEPSGVAIASTRTAILDAEASALRYGVDFLTGQSTNTATEADLRSTRVKVNLAFAGMQKESALQEILDYWSMYVDGVTLAKDPEAKGGSIEVSRDLLKTAMDPDYVNALSALVEKNQLSLATFLTLLADGRILRRGVDIEAEIEAIEEQKEAAMQSAISAVERQAKATNAYAGDDDGEGESSNE